MCARHERVPQTPSPRALWHLETSLKKGDSGELALQRHAQEKPHDKEASGEDQGIQALLLQPTPQILGVSFPVFMHKIRPHILKTGDRTPLKRGVGEQWPGSPWLGDPCRAPLVGPQLPPRWPRGPRCPMMPQLTSFLRSKGSESDRKLDPRAEMVASSALPQAPAGPWEGRSSEVPTTTGTCPHDDLDPSKSKLKRP